MSILLFASLAVGEPNEARTQHRQAIALFDLERYADAATKLESAFLLHEEAAILLDAALAWRQAGNLAAAIRVYRGYLRRAPPGSKLVATIEQCIADLQNAARRAKPRGCHDRLQTITWEPVAPPPAGTPAPVSPPRSPPPAVQVAPAIDDSEEADPPRRTAVEVTAAPTASQRTVYDPWNNRTYREPAAVAPTGATRTPEPPAVVLPPEGTAAPAIAITAPVAPPARKPVYKRAWFWVTLVLVGATAAGVAAGAAYSVPRNASSKLPTYDVTF